MTYKNIIICLLIITVGLGTWTGFLSYRPQMIRPSQLTLMPDALMEDVTAIIMNKQGRPKMKIVTLKLIHYAENDTTHLTAPQLTLYRESPQPWYITSRYAKATQGIESVNFWDDVIIQHSADHNNPATIIKTATLLVHPNQQTAETTEHITLTQSNTIIRATGMYADMNTGNVKLLSQTRGEYVPSS